jgi:hypothetical protein
MIDARNVYRKVTRKIMHFSPEQSQNLSAIVWLYRGQEQRFVELVANYLKRSADALEPFASAQPTAAGGELVPGQTATATTHLGRTQRQCQCD